MSLIKLDSNGKMLSWASYLFGGASTDAQPAEIEASPEQVSMETEAPADKEWVVVEHSGNDEAPRVGISDLENLLIEHPSMSVYKRSGSEGEDSNDSDLSSSMVVVKSKRSQALSRQGPRKARAVSARAELLAQVTQVKHAQKVQERRTTKRNNKKGLERTNKVAVCDKHVMRKSRVRNPSGQMNGRVPQRKQ